MSLRQRLRRIRARAKEGGVLVHQRDGGVKVFDIMQVHKEMFLARMDLLREESVNSEVLEAVRNATPESRRAFEEQFGPIIMVEHVIAGGYEGAWVKEYRLEEGGTVKQLFYEGSSPEAERIRAVAVQGGEG